MASKEIWLMDVPIAFAHGVFQKAPPANDPNGKPKYSSSFILTPDHKSLELLRKTEREVVMETKWKDDEDAKDVYDRLKKKDLLAVHDGNDKKKFEGFAGNFYVSASADTAPTAVDRDRNRIKADDGVLYSGCRVNAKVEVWAQDNSWGQRVNVAMLGVQFVADGDKWGGGAPPANPDDFPDLDAGGDDGDDALFG